MSVSFSVMSSKKVADLKKLLDENFVEVPFSKKANKVQKYLQKVLDEDAEDSGSDSDEWNACLSDSEDYDSDFFVSPD